MTPHQEILQLAERLSAAVSAADHVEFVEPIEKIETAALAVGRSASGSWLGYQSRVYYRDFKPPPAGVYFESDDGLDGSEKDWLEYKSDFVRTFIRQRAGDPDFSFPRAVVDKVRSELLFVQGDAISIVEHELQARPDKYLERLKSDLEKIRVYTSTEVIESIAPPGPFISSDILALSQGLQIPPHLIEVAEPFAMQNVIKTCRSAIDILLRIGAHIARKARRVEKLARIGTNVFIGHGRSPLWRELKDFIQDRTGLPWDEFNRVPVAGITNITRLSEMLDAAAIAFLVMTAEDERSDGTLVARMNVIHEAGLFQGRLGFTKAIVLIEEGCAEFSNTEGLGQIRFPKGRISAAFEEIRQVLEREELIF